jgi:hypothetical protein
MYLPEGLKAQRRAKAVISHVAVMYGFKGSARNHKSNALILKTSLIRSLKGN